MNQREFTRVRTRIPVDVEVGGKVVTGTIRDLSLNGMWMATPTPPPEEATCRVTLHLDGRGGAIVVRADGYVVRSVADGFAMHFQELLEVESYEHLRNLILYNAEDPAQAEQEFDSHLGLKRIDPAAPPPG